MNTYEAIEAETVEELNKKVDAFFKKVHASEQYWKPVGGVTMGFIPRQGAVPTMVYIQVLWR